jgi:vanillate O-demethylase monooxygenase subunit
MLLHEHYVDVTHIPEVHRAETPPGLDELPPLEQVQVSETEVNYLRNLPPAPLADWEAEVTGLSVDRTYRRRHYGTFLPPAVVDETWEIIGPDDRLFKVGRVNAVTPETAETTHLFFRIARNFAIEHPPVGRHLHEVMEHVMHGDVEVVETIQATVGYEGATGGININADAGALRVRRIVEGMIASEAGHTRRRFAAAAQTE